MEFVSQHLDYIWNLGFSRCWRRRLDYCLVLCVSL